MPTPDQPLPADKAVDHVREKIAAAVEAQQRPPKIPAWMPRAAIDLIRTAEKQFVGAKRGADRKRWVMRNLRDLAREHDLQNVPDWIETPMEEFLIHVVVEALFSVIDRVSSFEPGIPIEAIRDDLGGFSTATAIR